MRLVVDHDVAQTNECLVRVRHVQTEQGCNVRHSLNVPKIGAVTSIRFQHLFQFGMKRARRIKQFQLWKGSWQIHVDQIQRYFFPDGSGCPRRPCGGGGGSAATGRGGLGVAVVVALFFLPLLLLVIVFFFHGFPIFRFGPCTVHLKQFGCDS